MTLAFKIKSHIFICIQYTSQQNEQFIYRCCNILLCTNCRGLFTNSTGYIYSFRPDTFLYSTIIYLITRKLHCPNAVCKIPPTALSYYWTHNPSKLKRTTGRFSVLYTIEVPPDSSCFSVCLYNRRRPGSSSAVLLEVTVAAGASLVQQQEHTVSFCFVTLIVIILILLLRWCECFTVCVNHCGEHRILIMESTHP